ncbi:MAG: DUF4384 domain-containing protein [Chitinispirillaceae bacterium]|nr:DUF4384 domain-containing protein [Chitinispirillaceae bacterium]
MRKLIIPIFMIIVVFMTRSIFAQAEEVGDRNSTIVEADGYAFLSGDKTINELREEALQNAKRSALEMGETHVRSYTKVENFQLEYDIVVSEAEGKVQILEQKDHGVTADQRYHVWIKAEVTFILRSASDRDKSNIINHSYLPLHVILKTDKKEYCDRDQIQISIVGNKDFYARIVYETAVGELLQLFPNQHRQDALIKGGQKVNIPDDTDTFVLEAIGPPYGKEKIILYASTADLGDVDLDEYGSDFFKIKEDVTTVSKLTRGIKIVEEKKSEQFQGEEFFQTECDITVRSK